MTTVNVYLTFKGNCKAAFEFYQSVFGGEFQFIGFFKDMPPQEGMPPMSAEAGEKVMHVSLPISKETFLLGSDTDDMWSPNFTPGNNFSISISTDSQAEADRLYNSLVAGGQATMPMSQTFWSAYFGMLTDKFGINWMIGLEDEPK